MSPIGYSIKKKKKEKGKWDHEKNTRQQELWQRDRPDRLSNLKRSPPKEDQRYRYLVWLSCKTVILHGLAGKQTTV